MSLAIRSLAVCLLLALNGCGGGGSTSPGPPQNAPTAAPAGQTQATVVIKIPAASPPALQSLRPKYVSVNTQSITVGIDGGTPQAINLTPTSPGCSASGSPPATTCSIRFNSQFGSHTFAFVTFDGLNGSGNALSRNTLVSASPASGPWTINVTLNGVPASLSVAPLPASSFLRWFGNAAALYGTAPQSVALLALDADGNIIVGTGAPRLSMVASGSIVTVAQSTTTPNTFTLQATGGVVTPGTVNVTATATALSDAAGSAPPAQVSSTVPLRLAHSVVAATLSFMNQSVVQEFYDGATTPSFTTAVKTAAGTSYAGIAVASTATSDNLYALDYGLGVFDVYPVGAASPSQTVPAPPGSVRVKFPGGFLSQANPFGAVSGASAAGGFAITWGTHQPASLAVDQSGTLYAGYFDSSLAAFNAPLTNASAPSVSAGLISTCNGGQTCYNVPFGLAIDPVAGVLYAALVGAQPGAASPSSNDCSKAGPPCGVSSGVAVYALPWTSGPPTLRFTLPGDGGCPDTGCNGNGGIGYAPVDVDVAVDGSLYVANSKYPSNVVVFAPAPSSSNAKPSATLEPNLTPPNTGPNGNGSWAVQGVAVVPHW